MEKTELKKAQAVCSAIDTLADFFGETFNSVGDRLVFFDDARRDKINRAIELHNEFQDMDFEGRARAFGYEPVKTKRGYEITTELTSPPKN